ncbi:hypothetical protein KW850_30505 [Bacillus sp. sid0103]|uniref:hypothetical protein n=1 Tax=Bacillus sp. sid0103 TaxID=2856337 RepID=UPI001C49754A|nr:hypothetical protein [Bacillus sp. sid0103]MBV7509493.1 hypothetical protein [Bacillus sp. sid0103]
MKNNDSIKKSQQLGFHKLWNKFEGYEIVEDYVIGKGIINGGLDAPAGYAELPSQVAKLNNRKEKDLIKFFQAYGPFGYQQLKDDYFSYKGEPLEWIWAHAQGIYLVLELAKSLRDVDFERIINVIKPFEVETDIKTIPNQKFVFKIGDKGSIIQEPYSVGILNKESALHIAGILIPNIINRNIVGINEQIYRPIDQTEYMYKSRYSFTAMIEVVYWHLKNAILGAEFRRCKYCNTPFIVVHGSNEYCPKRHFEKESLCAINFRQKERRKKLRQQEE